MLLMKTHTRLVGGGGGEIAGVNSKVPEISYFRVNHKMQTYGKTCSVPTHTLISSFSKAHFTDIDQALITVSLMFEFNALNKETNTEISFCRNRNHLHKSKLL
jgi:hypothetical protein